MPQNEQKINWTPKNIETLERMWRAGDSAAVISFALSGSKKNRNAVIAKANRMKLPPHPNRIILGEKSLAMTPKRKKYAGEAMLGDKGNVRKSNLSPRPKPTKAKPQFDEEDEDMGIRASRGESPKAQNVTAARLGEIPYVDSSKLLASPVWRGEPKLTLMQLTEHTCKWPLEGADGVRGFCGEHTEPKPLDAKGRSRGSFPYCAYHHSRAVTPKVTE